MSDDFELERIRMEKMRAMLKAQEAAALEEQRQKNQPTFTDKLEALLSVVLEPQALQYLKQIKANNSEVYQKVVMNLLPPDLMYEIDTLMQYLARGQIRRGVIGLTEVQFIERKVLGIESQIVIKNATRSESLTIF